MSAGRDTAGSSSGVTRTGPSGVVASKVLPCSHSRVRNCQSRMVTSLITVKPGDRRRGLRPVGAAHGLADHDDELGLPVHALRLGRGDDVVVRRR